MDRPTTNKIFGIKFAPLQVPLERRLQTLAALGWFSSFFCGLTVFPICLLYITICTSYWYMTFIYLLWMIYDKDTPHIGGRRIESLRKSKIWCYFRDYFPIKFIKTADLPPNGSYLFCVHPHGMLSAGALLNFQSEANNFSNLYPGLTPYLCVLDAIFRLPFYRDLALALGFCGVSENSIKYILNGRDGNSCVLMVGGASEALNANPGEYKIILNNRKGFVRVALKTGSSLVPVFSFGENDLYDQIKGEKIERFQKLMHKLIGFIPCLIKGRGIFQYSFGVIPFRKTITTVVGDAIKLPKISNPTQEDVKEYHDKYTEALRNLFDTYKDKHYKNNEPVKLIIQ